MSLHQSLSEANAAPPRQVFNEVRALGSTAEELFAKEYRPKHGRFYGLIVFTGWHYAYLGMYGTQFLFHVTGGGLGVWWLLDFLVRHDELLAHYNAE